MIEVLFFYPQSHNGTRVRSSQGEKVWMSPPPLDSY